MSQQAQPIGPQYRVLGINSDAIEEFINGPTKCCQRPHRGLEILSGEPPSIEIGALDPERYA